MTGAEELKAIRDRHLVDSEWSDDKWQALVGRIADDAHTDRAFLLAEVERLRKVLLFVRSCADRNAVPGQPKTKLHAFGRISGRITEALNGEPAQ